MSEIREQELLDRLRALATAEAQRVASPGVRVRVMKAWDARQDAFRTPRRASLRVWLPVAASLTIVVGLMVGSIRQPPASGGKLTASDAVNHDVVEHSVLTVSDASVLPRFDHGELIRVEIASPAGAIQAEVLIGQDGLARAIRVIR